MQLGLRARGLKEGLGFGLVIQLRFGVKGLQLKFS